MKPAPFGFYAHIPYCRALCHYCDFAKTANFGERETQAFLQRMEEHTRLWLRWAEEAGHLERPGPGAPQAGFSSVFFGGGTPSLFANEYEGLLGVLTPWLLPGAEVSLEANPDDITGQVLTVWRNLGFNRLSLGVQTFAERGLKAMQRIHDAGQAKRAIQAALEAFPSLNIDLIYGWPGQTRDDFVRDLNQALALGVPHLSLYTLTYESRTPIGRAAQRGLLKPHSDDQLAAFYEDACGTLAEAGYVHEEVSNWSRPGASCRHNWLYWDDAPFIGVGPGAHGYLPSAEPQGIRYAYPRSDRVFLKGQTPESRASMADSLAPHAELARRFGIEIEPDRDLDIWLIEYVGASLRTRRGTDLTRMEQRLNRSFTPTPLLREAFDRGLCRIGGNEACGQRLVFVPAEWFREVAWAVEVLGSFPAK